MTKGNPLIEEKSWKEIVEHIVYKSKNWKPDFKKWLLSKEYLGGYFFNPLLYSRLYNIKKSINEDDMDHFIVVTGKEGTGKSTLAVQIASLVDPTFNLNRVCFKMADYLNQLRHSKPGQAFILDEGNMFLFSRESYSEDNRFMVKLFALMRQRNLLTIICVPNFFTLDSYVRDHRADTLIYSHKRGKFICYVKVAIKIISKLGSAYKRVGGHKIPSGTFFAGYWNKEFPSINNVNQNTYKEHKAQHFAKFLDEISKFSKMKEGNTKFIPMTKARKILPLSHNGMISAIESGEIKARKIVGKWFIDREHLEGLVNDKNVESINIDSKKEESEGGGKDREEPKKSILDIFNENNN